MVAVDHEPAFGELRLDQIRVHQIETLKAALLDKNLSRKRVNNVLAVLGKLLRYALILTGSDAGLRQGEMIALQWDDSAVGRPREYFEVEGRSAEIRLAPRRLVRSRAQPESSRTAQSHSRTVITRASLARRTSAADEAHHSRVERFTSLDFVRKRAE